MIMGIEELSKIEWAFPFMVQDENEIRTFSGMQLRDYFAAKALQGMFTTAAAPCLSGLGGHEEITAEAAYKMADAMLKAREASHG
jgi:hypothetical protein